MSSFSLHAVIIDKKIPLVKAKKTAADIIKEPTRKFYRETEDSYRFRNIPKTKFDKSSFRSKVISPAVTLVFGKLRK